MTNSELYARRLKFLEGIREKMLKGNNLEQEELTTTIALLVNLAIEQCRVEGLKSLQTDNPQEYLRKMWDMKVGK